MTLVTNIDLSPASSAPFNSYGFISFNGDGSQIMVASVSSKKPACFNVSDGSMAWEMTAAKNVRDIAWNPQTNEWMMVTNVNKLFVINNSGVDTEKLSLPTIGANNYNIHISPNKERMLIDGSSNTSTGLHCVNLNDYTTVPIPHMGQFNSNAFWFDDDTVYQFSGYASNAGVYQYVYDGTSYVNKGRIGTGFFMNGTSGGFIQTTPYHVSFGIVDNADENEFVAYALNLDLSVLLGRTEISAGQSLVTIPLQAKEPVIVVVAGKKATLLERSKYYSVGDIVFLVGNLLEYTCITAGETAVAPVNYPNTGTVTDGNAVFEVRGKLPHPIANAPLIPELTT